ncbi:MAG: Holliday junction resolvase RuvX [Planctomycetota bacterium]
MSCILGIDYGSKRIGLAISDSQRTFSLPLTTVESRGDVHANAAVVLEKAGEYDVSEFVVGLPLNMDGTEGPQTKETRTFGEVLKTLSGRPVHYFDERLSSVAAEEMLRPAELTRLKRRARVDRLAAQVILQDFLDSRGT